ncbi:MAG TPA: 5,10-methylenetetrahydrofolate reductase [Spirochaetes bacterium]|nr:5,10-methylenetetrahydrofolate reductase [Spirochaetota bacterium]
MIVTRKKDPLVIKELTKPFKKLIIVGCSECAAVCQTGGSEQVKEMAALLAGHEITATISIESPCDKRVSARDFRRIEEELAAADALVVLACGSGAQAVSEVTEKPVITALDTRFLGMVERLGRFYERCSQCGNCILNDTAALCPITLCPRGIRNGPCECIDGTRCDVYPDRDCVWHTIYEKLKQSGRPDLYTLFHEPTDWLQSHTPREELWEKK